MKAFAKKGHSFKDWICPDTMEFHNDHFKLGEQYGRVLFMEDYASYVTVSYTHLTLPTKLEV